MLSPRSSRAGTALVLLALPLALGCTVEKTYDADAAESAAAMPDTVTRVDTVVQVDTVRIPDDSLPGLGDVGLDSSGAFVAGSAPVDTGAAAGGTSRSLAASGSPSDSGTSEIEATPAELETLRTRALRMPVQGVAASALRDNFDEPRGGGPHEALDIAAPRGTPVVSVDEGRVAKLFTSRAGGITVYVLGPQERFVYYYAHLDRYRDGLAEGDQVRKGDVLGYVGTSGNARDVPHLHFAIARVTDPKRWWAGRPVNPYPLLAGAGADSSGRGARGR